ncbi:hypothetical protein EV641_106294 [Rhodococcus sp. SMB37]|nr:hypothetical protein EV641_106294 [Rhodococcus sp. SMB37]
MGELFEENTEKPDSVFGTDLFGMRAAGSSSGGGSA